MEVPIVLFYAAQWNEHFPPIVCVDQGTAETLHAQQDVKTFWVYNMACMGSVSLSMIIALHQLVTYWW